MNKINILRWFGGKYYMLEHILPFPKHDLYVEVFGGSGTVLLNKIPSRREIFNDLNDRLINFFRVLQKHDKELKQYCLEDGWVHSRKIFEECKVPSFDQVEDAFRFFYVNYHSFSGANNTFTRSFKKNPHQTYFNKITQFDKIKNRLKNVVIENQDFRQLLKSVDRKGALWYLDPPYINGGQEYEKMIGGNNWSNSDLEDLKQVLLRVKHAKFVLSIDDPEFLDPHEYHLKQFTKINHASSTVRTSRVECLFKNFGSVQTIPLTVDLCPPTPAPSFFPK